jgi:hypothetical protein
MNRSCHGPEWQVADGDQMPLERKIGRRHKGRTALECIRLGTNDSSGRLLPIVPMMQATDARE